jgi:hypothetical protein
MDITRQAVPRLSQVSETFCVNADRGGACVRPDSVVMHGWAAATRLCVGSCGLFLDKTYSTTTWKQRMPPSKESGGGKRWRRSS